jgi:hypothetical protein
MEFVLSEFFSMGALIDCADNFNELYVTLLDEVHERNSLLRLTRVLKLLKPHNTITIGCICKLFHFCFGQFCVYPSNLADSMGVTVTEMHSEQT